MLPTLGILGGMGPAATAEFLKEVTLQTPAQRDQDHFPSVALSDVTVPDRTTAILGGVDDVTSRLREDCEKLISWGAQALACPCNTAHYFLRTFTPELLVPFIDIVEATADQAVHRARAWCTDGPPTAWLTCTQGTVQSGLYQKAAAARGLHLLVPSQEYFEEFSAIIALVKSGGMAEAGARWWRVFADLTGERDVPVLTACTELPLAHEASGLPGEREVSSLKALAYATIKTMGVTPLPRVGVDPI
ncbi:amino acid racemase [Actinomycetaceae bacterium L2_0104]